MKAFLLFILLSFSVSILANSPLPNNRHISVSGEAQLEAKPDSAIISLEVESTQKESIDAKKEVDNRINKLLDGLSKFAIKEEDVSASRINTQPDYDYQGRERVLKGYQANRTVKISLNNIDKLNELLDFALSVQINQIQNIELKSTNEKALQDEVNALAVKNAKQKGSSLAQAFDAKLGKIYSINSASSHMRSRYGANHDVERIQVTGVRLNKPGKYLYENIVFSANINVVFDLTTD